MKQLAPPNLDAKNIFNTIKDRSKSEKKGILQLWQSYVYERYDEYELNTYNLEDISNSNIIEDIDKKAFTSCYTRNSKGYLEGEVVVKIIALQTVQHQQKCPYCGLDKPRTIDHYLPKSEFPEFSIYPPNLIPCCGYCNNKKSDKWITNGKRTYINLYFDDIPKDKQFLFANLDFNDRNIIPTIYFTIENKDEIEEEIYELIERHYLNLNLLTEFSHSVEEFFSCILDEIKHNRELSMSDHKENLIRRYDTNVRKYGLNYWISSFLKTLIESDEFFERCENL